MALHRGLELSVLGRGQARDLSTPAVSEDRPGLEGLAVGGELVRFVDEGWNLGQICRRSSLGLEEIAQLLLVFFGLRREPGDVRGLALEEVRHEDTIFLLARGSEDIGALNCLREKAEDVFFFFKVTLSCFSVGRNGWTIGRLPTVDDEDGLGGRVRASNV